MLLTILAYGMIIIFMYVIMKKKLSPFTSLVIIPLIFTLIAIATGVASPPLVLTVLSLKSTLGISS